ncbi:MAG: hypothetical protein QF793_02860 [Candidatus Peribacteraceae bacterium]|jgi:hypothetical protein|nr:hypothetical protein [bacterium]MDP6561843.1 hypothetical protein [Candidatus Peribacteraceae bacterium]|tara:strand:+ start:2020 stop:2598 length:579 start_codon:yes stop_codon:yes gene_type:complete
MPLLYLFVATILSACTANISQQVEPLDIVRELAFEDAPEVQLNLLESGNTFLGKFSTNSALNSQRNFIADFHGEVRITLYLNKKVECTWWAEGRITDPTVYDGVNGFLEAYTTLCTGKLQRDGSFEFQGAYATEGPSEESDETFTLIGIASDEMVQGRLLIGGLLRNTVTLNDPSALLEGDRGVLYEAVFLE